MKRSSEQGSVLVYVLIAVVLFAALSFAITKSDRGDTQGKGEVPRLQASEILQYARAMQNAVQTMKVDGIADDQISFKTPLVSGYNNTKCTADGCMMFLPTGGDVSYAAPVAQWLDREQSANANFGNWVFSGNNMVTGVDTDNNTSSAVDLVAILPWLRKDLCVQINDMLHIDNPGGSPPSDGGDAELATKFLGTYTPSQSIGGPAALNAQRTGCFQGGGDPAPGTYHFYQVLLAR